MKSFLTHLLVFFAGLALGEIIGVCFIAPRPPAPTPKPQVDTVYISDTITIDKPVPVVRKVVDSIRVPVSVPVFDTLRVRDTILISLPREELVYEDTTYRAVVSGYRPSLDTISVYPITTIITKVEKEKTQPRVSLGVQGGVGVMYEGGFHAGPYIGIGIQYNLFNF